MIATTLTTLKMTDHSQCTPCAVFRSGRRVTLVLAFLLLIAPRGAAAHGDKIVPHLADGAGVIRTKLDITNLSPAEPISRIKIFFFRQDGSPWVLTTNQGSASEIAIHLGRFQTLRIETLGSTPSLTAGYALVRNSEPNSTYAEDFEVAITVFYEILSGPNVIDTVSVPLGEPTVSWLFPVELDVSRNLLTGFAVVNLSTGTNTVTLRLWEARGTSSSDAIDAGSTAVSLGAREQRARFLNEGGLFPDKRSFKGMLFGTAQQPVAVLALLQTATAVGVQYATMQVATLDSLRINTSIYLRQGYPLDGDIPISDYFRNSDDGFSWDLLYATQSTTSRRLEARSGAEFSTLGTRTDEQFDTLTLDQLRALGFSRDPIDLSDVSPNLTKGFVFAIKTGLGRYVKARISEINSRSSDPTMRDLALEVFVYR